ncbi:hypothetical protein [Luteimonas panaciterrae]|uniref:hypothetical protein n=1 Tax=Luteimonas panaciterrae TaxID=363885 RepID=UPI001CFAD596|nr:hypothetical protein [Luteimonas panaciterrae]
MLGKKYWIPVTVIALAIGISIYLHSTSQNREEVTLDRIEVANSADTGALPPSTHDVQSIKTGHAGRRLKMQSYDPPSGNAVDVINQLKPLAEAGDAKASFLIYMKLHSCLGAMRPTDPEVQEAYRKAGITIDQAATERELIECEGLQGEDYSSRSKWLELAADNGLLEAQLAYSTDSKSIIGGAADRLKDPDKVKRYKQKASAYLLNAANHGSVEALMSLSSSYREGVLFDKNMVNAYAYYKAAQMASPELDMSSVLRSYENQLSSDELKRGANLSQEIYNRCCK